MMESVVTKNGKTTTERSYDISRLDTSAKYISHAIGRHWAIENSLHWVLDVTLGEDASVAPKQGQNYIFSIENFNGTALSRTIEFMLFFC